MVVRYSVPDSTSLATTFAAATIADCGSETRPAMTPRSLCAAASAAGPAATSTASERTEPQTRWNTPHDLPPGQAHSVARPLDLSDGGAMLVDRRASVTHRKLGAVQLESAPSHARARPSRGTRRRTRSALARRTRHVELATEALDRAPACRRGRSDDRLSGRSSESVNPRPSSTMSTRRSRSLELEMHRQVLARAVADRVLQRLANRQDEAAFRRFVPRADRPPVGLDADVDPGVEPDAVRELRDRRNQPVAG